MAENKVLRRKAENAAHKARPEDGPAAPANDLVATRGGRPCQRACLGRTPSRR